MGLQRTVRRALRNRMFLVKSCLAIAACNFPVCGRDKSEDGRRRRVEKMPRSGERWQFTLTRILEALVNN